MVVELEGVVIDEVALTFRSKNPHEGEIPDSVTSVELEGIEPSSKQEPYAFYMLILVFIFVMQQDPSHQLQPYPLKLHPPVEAPKRLFPIYLHRYTFLIRNNIQKSDVSFSHLVRE